MQDSSNIPNQRSSEMAGDKTPRGMQQDRKLISLEQDYEVRYWMEALGVTVSA